MPPSASLRCVLAEAAHPAAGARAAGPLLRMPPGVLGTGCYAPAMAIIKTDGPRSEPRKLLRKRKTLVRRPKLPTHSPLPKRRGNGYSSLSGHLHELHPSGISPVCRSSDPMSTSTLYLPGHSPFVNAYVCTWTKRASRPRGSLERVVMSCCSKVCRPGQLTGVQKQVWAL